MKPASLIRIERMRKGEKIKCPRCEEGYFSAVGNPKTTKVFKCGVCGLSIVLTIPLRENFDIQKQKTEKNK